MSRRRAQSEVRASPRGFAKQIAALQQALAEPAMEGRSWRLHGAVSQLFFADEGLPDDLGKVQEVLGVARAFRETPGPGLAHAEETLFLGLENEVRRWCQGLTDDDGLEPFLDLHAVEQVADDFRLGAAILAELCAFALETLGYAARPRDSSAGVRRAGAFGILGEAAELCDVSEALEPAREALRRNRRQEVAGALVFLEKYYVAREDERVPKAIKAEILAVATKTTSRAIAVTALNVLVETGDIGEFEAFDRLDRWKAKHFG